MIGTEGWEIDWFWNVWVFGFYWTPYSVVVKIGPLHVGYWTR